MRRKMIVGALGLILILLGWVLGYKQIPNLRFALLYFMGSFLLAIHTFAVKEYVSFTLNAILTVLSLINLYRSIREARSS